MVTNEKKFNKNDNFFLIGKWKCRLRLISAKVAEYTGDLILVGINYDKETKTHQCKMETVTL